MSPFAFLYVIPCAPRVSPLAQVRALCAHVWLVDQWQLASDEAARAAEDMAGVGGVSVELLQWRLLAAAVLRGLAAASGRHKQLVAALTGSPELREPAWQPLVGAAVAWLASSPRALPIAAGERRVKTAWCAASDASRALEATVRAFGALGAADSAAVLFLADTAPHCLWSVVEHATEGPQDDDGERSIIRRVPFLVF